MRLFIGTFLNRENQAFYERSVAKLVSRSAGMLRAIPGASAHITYAFLGEVNDALAGEVLGAVRQAATRVDAIPIVLGPPHILYARREARLVCADVISGGEEIRRLAQNIGDRMRLVCPGMAAEGMKAPHVTLARFRKGATRSDAQAVVLLLGDAGLASASREDCIESIQVVSSRLTGAGPVYETRGKVSLGIDPENP